MLVRFEKPHPAGIPEGAIKDLKKGHAERLIADGYAVECTPELVEVPPVEPVLIGVPVDENATAAELIELLTNGDDNQPVEEAGTTDEAIIEPVEVDLTQKTNAELKQMLTEKGIAFKPGDAKAKLIELLTNGDDNN